MEQTALEALEVICNSSNDINKDIRKRIIIERLQALEIAIARKIDFYEYSHYDFPNLNYQEYLAIFKDAIEDECLLTETEFNLVQKAFRK